MHAPIRFLTLLAFALGFAGVTHAAVVVPPGLEPGDQYRLMFLSSTTTDATSSDIADYNAFVTAVAETQGDLSALGTTWTALVSTATVDARDNTTTNPGSGAGAVIYQLNGSLAFSGNLDLWDGVNSLALDVFEDGTKISLKKGGPVAFSGSDLTGVASDPVGDGGFAETGTAKGATWISGAKSADETSLLRLYGISDVLTVVPEPGTILLVLLGLGGYAASGRPFP